MTVTLSDDPERKLVIPITTTGQGGATSTDYSVPTSVMFNAGETSNAITFTATQDSEDDDGESVLLAFGTILPDRVIRGSVSTTTVSITDDDTAGVTVMPTALTIEEGATSTYTVVLDSEPVGQVTVTISGHTGTDVLLNTTTLTFSSESWDTPQTVTAEQDGDAEDDIPVTLMHTVASTDQDYDEASVSSATVSITDDDDPVVSVSIESAANAVAEGATTTVTVTLSADPEREVVIPLTATGQGGATSTDYSGVPADVTFPSGETEKSFVFGATQDDDDDDGESVVLGFGTLPGRVSEGTPDQATVSITDDDDPVVSVSIESAADTVAEGATTTVTVTLSADPEREVVIPLTKANQDGATSTGLLRRSGERDVREWGDREELRVRRYARQRGRRRGERGGRLRYSA